MKQYFLTVMLILFGGKPMFSWEKPVFRKGTPPRKDGLLVGWDYALNLMWLL